VNAEDKTVAVEIAADSNVLGTVVVILLILGLVGGIVLYGARLARK
jgi:hypothetical protein